jgi:hypothetical protein
MVREAMHRNPTCVPDMDAPVEEAWGIRQYRQLHEAKEKGQWSDGAPIGRGHGQPYLECKYAKAIRRRKKRVEGRPGGGWVESSGRLIAPNDYINFKISGQDRNSMGDNLIVGARVVPCASH